MSLLDGVPADNLFATGRQAKRLFDQGRYGAAWGAARAQWTLPGVRRPSWHALRVMAGCLAPTALHAWRERMAEAAEYRALQAASLASAELTRRADMRGRYRRYRSSVRNSHQWHPADEALSSLAAPYITAGLERFNRVASLFGVEPRPPFTDRDLITFQAWVPIALRTRDGHAKWILRQAMRPLLPAAVVWRTDKSHIGWAFNNACLVRHLASGAACHMAPLTADWLDAARLQAACQHPANASAAGLAAALRVLLWSQTRFSTAPKCD